MYTYKHKAGAVRIIVTVIGCKRYKQIVTTGIADVSLPHIKIFPKTIALNEVKIRPGFNRAKYFNEFKAEFLGRSDFAAQSYLVNPDIVDIDDDPATKVLTASTGDYLEIENKALGYKLKYYLNKFIKDNTVRRIYYEGFVLFEPLDGTPSQLRRWLKNRKAIYTSSAMHLNFIKSSNLGSSPVSASMKH